MILTAENEYAALLDSCVLVPMPLCDTLLRLAEEPALYRPLWSPRIFGEVEHVLIERLGHTPDQAKRRLDYMNKAFPEAMVTPPDSFIASITCIPDVDDRHVLAAAMKGHAQAIVTSNGKDFPDECLEEYDILKQSPDDFLVHQYHLSPQLILDKIDAQAAAIRRDSAWLVTLLQKCTPTFAGLVASRT